MKTKKAWNSLYGLAVAVAVVVAADHL